MFETPLQGTQCGVLILWFETGKKGGYYGYFLETETPILWYHSDKRVSHRVRKHSVTWAKKVQFLSAAVKLVAAARVPIILCSPLIHTDLAVELKWPASFKI